MRSTIHSLTAGLVCLTVCLTVPLLTIAGCGGLADPEKPQKTLLTLQGEVTNAAQVSATGQVRMALVWSNAAIEQDANTFAVSQDIPMQAQFPASFTLQINTLPPAEMVIAKEDLPADEQEDVPDGFSFAIGGLVVYADDNGNGQLDLIDVGDQPVDRILGADEDMHMLFFAGAQPPPLVPPDKLDGSFGLGYNLLTMPECLFAMADEGCDDKAKVYTPQNGTIAGVIIPLTQDPKLARWMCKSGFGGDSAAGSAIGQSMGPAQPPYPDPDDPKLHCIDGGLGYEIRTCTEITKGPCSGTEISCASEYWEIPDASSPPAAWPCPLRVPPTPPAP